MISYEFYCEKYNKSFPFQEKQVSNSSDHKKLICGGKACLKCGACRDWYFDSNKGSALKRDGAKCIHDNIFSHDLIRNPKDECSYPIGRIICECEDNH